jgi:predicted AAA+ superfamily ATPase
MKTWHAPDATMMGRYAENLVARELITWSEGVEVSYFREKDLEVDFVLTHSGDKYLPIEVKHRQKTRELAGLKHFMRKYHLKSGIVITNDQESHGDEILHLPLRYFLLATQ